MKKENPIEEFKKEVRQNVKRLGKNKKLQKLGMKFMVGSIISRYSYNFCWLGRPIIQYPEDIVAIQELIWDIKPDLIIEAGIAHGGSIILSASILDMIGGRGKVLGIDIDIRKHNRKEIEGHRMFKNKRIIMIEGSSIDLKVIEKVRKIAKSAKRVLIFLDSNHAHDHVLKELELYSPLVTKGSYIVVFDTIANYLPKGAIKNRPWNEKHNPKTALDKFLPKHKNFAVDKEIEYKFLITAAPGGFIKRIF